MPGVHRFYLQKFVTLPAAKIIEDVKKLPTYAMPVILRQNAHHMEFRRKFASVGKGNEPDWFVIYHISPERLSGAVIDVFSRILGNAEPVGQGQQNFFGDALFLFGVTNAMLLKNCDGLQT